MTSVRFFHTADIHFGVENYGRIDSATGIHTRLLDFEKALATIIDAAIKDDIDLFVFSGDAYKTPYPTPTQQKLLLQQFFRLQEHGIPVVIVVGNHDHPLSFGKAHALDVFGAIRQHDFHVISRPQACTITTKKGPVQLVGIPWPMRNNVLAKGMHQLKTSREITEYLSAQVVKIIARLAQDLDPSLPSVLAGHLTVATGIFSGSEKRAIYGNDPVFLPSQLAITPFDYVALGHLHRYQNLNKGGIPVVYSGSPERVDFGERKEEKGYCDVTITCKEGRKETKHSFVTLPTRPMIQIELHLEEGKNQTESILSKIEEYDLTGAIVKIVYHVPAGVSDRVDIAVIQKACQSAHYLTGVVPVHVVKERVQRTAVTSEMSTKVLLETYFKAQNVQKEKQERLVEKALDLARAVEREAERGDEAHDDS